jgi:protein-S-isoprenylcysteine O-methyltransferase Ste14
LEKQGEAVKEPIFGNRTPLRAARTMAIMDDSSNGSTDHSGVALPPPLIYIAFFLIGMGFQRYLPIARMPVGIGRVLGALFGLSCLKLTTWSIGRFWASGTSIVPIRPTTALVIEGPYRLTRNPMYLGLLLLYVGVACWFGLLWPLLLAPVLMGVMSEAVIRREERYLTSKFGDEYRRYQTRVRRWL